MLSETQEATLKYGDRRKEPYFSSPRLERPKRDSVATMRLDLPTTPVLTVAFDANGNTLSDAQGRSFTWDFENRLTQVVNPGVGTTNFKYDPFGRRIQKSGPLGTTNYLYTGSNLIEEVDGGGNVIARYAQGPRIDQVLAVLRSGIASYYEQDALGTVTSLSSPEGVPANTYAYDSFGKLIASTGTITNPFRHMGREFDGETGIYYYRARHYDPSVGRFISEDPVDLRETVSTEMRAENLFSYVHNSPLDYIDLDGKSPVAVVGGVAIAVTGWVTACQKAAVRGAMAAYSSGQDKKRHCFGGCYFQRCTAAMGPASTAILALGAVAWEVIPGWVSGDSWGDIQAGLWGGQQSWQVWRSCRSICDDCRIK